LLQLGNVEVTGGLPSIADGRASYDIQVTNAPFASSSLIGKFITVLATDSDGVGRKNSSELSACFVYVESDELFKNGFEQ
jgi:hypothetical protein